MVLEFANNADARIPAKLLGCVLLRSISVHKVKPEEQRRFYYMAKDPFCNPTE